MSEKDPILVARDAMYAEAKEQTLDTLPAFLQKLAQADHDYNTIAYAVTASALAAARAMDRSPKGGITGFQASFVMWDFIAQFMHMDGPMRLIEFKDLMFPQYAHKFRTIPADVWAKTQETAIANLADHSEFTHPNVIAHWETIAAGVVPFGLTIGS